jgi:signal recognition particle receptor subunit alpha
VRFTLALNIICRSGAVEQLRVHVRNLSMLGVNGATNSKGRVELYEKGYGKDAAGIAKEAIAYGKGCLFFWVHFDSGALYLAKDNDFDVVLIDTAGRMQDNEVSISALLVSLS